MCSLFVYHKWARRYEIISPFECTYARIATVPSAIAPVNKNLTETYFDYVTNLKTEIREIQINARENLKQTKVLSKEYYIFQKYTSCYGLVYTLYSNLREQ